MQNFPLIIAHRGESFDAPENTLASINLAWERDADAVEIDIRLTEDKRVVVIHDKTTGRVGGRNKRVKHQSLLELKELDVGSWKNEKFRDEKIPTLSEVLKTVPENKRIIIEIKTSPKIIPFLKEEINFSDLNSQQIEIISFNYEAVKEAKKAMPELKVLYLADLDYTWMTKVFSPPVDKLIEKVKAANLNGLNVWAGKLLTEKFAYNVKWSDLDLYVWTVNNPEHAKRLIDWNVDAITTDKAEWMKNCLKNNYK